MEYLLKRYEKIRDHDGNITEIFISIAVDNGEEIYNYGYWFTTAEVGAVLANGSTINDIVNKASAAGKIAQENFIATRALPIIQESVDNITIDPTDVEGYLP